MSVNTIARVFPRRTSATPVDNLAFFPTPANPHGDLPGSFLPEISEVHISVTFTQDLARAEALEKEWRHVAPVRIGGPATGMRGEDFTPGLYVRDGYVITSRGCPNRCWFCSVWRREGQEVRELPITEGWNLLDDNILATSDAHFEAVCEMLMRQKAKGHRIEFTGGLEAARLTRYHAEKLRLLRPKQLFFAYDTPDDYEPLVAAGGILRDGGFAPLSTMRCYVLIGYPKDTFDAAERRLLQTIDAGFMPQAMLYLGNDGKRDPQWARFQRLWARPAIIREAIIKAPTPDTQPSLFGDPR